MLFNLLGIGYVKRGPQRNLKEIHAVATHKWKKSDKQHLKDKLEVFQENQGRQRHKSKKGKDFNKWHVSSHGRGLRGEQGGGRKIPSLFLLQRDH